MENNALIVIENLNPAEIFQNEGIKKVLDEIRSKVDSVVFDIETEEGRKECASMAHKVARSKTLLDNMGKELVSDQKKEIKRVDGLRKDVRDTLDALKSHVRTPLTQWEEAEAKRKVEEEAKERAKVQAQVDKLMEYGKSMSFFDVAALSEDEYDTILQTAISKHEAEQERLAKEKAEREAEEKRLVEERAELDRLRKEQEERDRIEREKREAEEKKLAEERAALEAEKKAIEDAKRAEQEAKEKAEREEQERIEREAAEKKEQERQLALKPDKEKLLGWVNEYIDKHLPQPNISSEEAARVHGWFTFKVEKLLEEFVERVESLNARFTG